MHALHRHCDGVPHWATPSSAIGTDVCPHGYSGTVNDSACVVPATGEGTVAGEGIVHSLHAMASASKTMSTKPSATVSIKAGISTPIPTVLEKLPQRLDEYVYDEPGYEYRLCHVTQDQQRLLWHLRFAHIHSRRVSDMHKFAIGVPKVKIATELDVCPKGK